MRNLAAVIWALGWPLVWSTCLLLDSKRGAVIADKEGAAWLFLIAWIGFTIAFWEKAK